MRRNGIIAIVVIIIFLLAGVIYFAAHTTQSPKPISPTSTTPTGIKSTSGSILFPAGGETLVKGQTYTLKWTGGTGNTQIFLIDTALEGQGESVAISDRVYNIPNSGSYEYTIPKNLSDSTYRFEIGTSTSNPFQISSNKNFTSYCAPNQLQANLSLEPAAGNIYGTFTIKNTSNTTCQVSGNSFITANYASTIKNIAVTHVGEPTQSTYTLEPNQTLYSQLHYPNGPQCSSAAQSTPVTFRYAVSPNKSITFTNSNGNTAQNVATCKASDEETTIQIWNISDKPITP